MLFTFLLAGCLYDENLPQIDITGTVVIPKAAATRTVVSAADTNGDGVMEYTTSEVTDPRLIGPVYLGAFAGVDDVSFSYPHPSMGPIITTDYPGDTFPYGGTTVGRVDFACYETLSCKVSTGRFTDYDDVIDYFTNLLGRPILDKNGNVVDNSSVFQQYCYDYSFVTSDQEISFIGEPEFTENADGDYEAPFTMAHTTFVEGMTLWGWMDAPQIGLDNTDANGSFSTCDASSAGRQYIHYDQDFYEGRPFYDLLNYPSLYVFDGDWTGDGTTTVTSRDGLDPDGKSPTINLSVYLPEQ